MRDIREEIEKIEEVVTEPIFGFSEYVDSTGRKLPCYEFGKTGAMQIALRYDAKTRYKVIKRIEELEQGCLVTSSTITQEVAESFDATLKIAGLVGLEGTQAKLSTNLAIKKMYGIDCLGTRCSRSYRRRQKAVLHPIHIRKTHRSVCPEIQCCAGGCRDAGAGPGA